MPPELTIPYHEEAQEKCVEVEGWEGPRFVPCSFVASDKKAEGLCACCGVGCGAQVGLSLSLGCRGLPYALTGMQGQTLPREL